MDGMVMNVASALASVVTNPFGKVFYQGDRAAPLEAASACAGMYWKGAGPLKSAFWAHRSNPIPTIKDLPRKKC
ncbi:hypothetical protein PR202_gb17469 [Eleusine coracana subsp. coracana]|uniref:Uncharacterized protein n=1 Tax=Eleusine coracana subsp. coracana TaxID=191504 RepID=A0AAV5F343_ELECO|nr:hypothetical protein PR202_gb17469 [Eleusine coracana subsp. coracana]